MKISIVYPTKYNNKCINKNNNCENVHHNLNVKAINRCEK